MGDGAASGLVGLVNTGASAYQAGHPQLGSQAFGRYAQDLTAMSDRIGRSGEIPTDVKKAIQTRIQDAQAGLRTALDDSVITPGERTDLVRDAQKLGGTADAIVAAQKASPNAPVPADTYRAIVRP